MAHFNLQGRWLQGNYEINIVMTGATEFNIKAVSAELQQYWQAGYGEVFESGKVRVTLTGHDPDAEFQGFVTTDGRRIQFPDGAWLRK